MHESYVLKVATELVLVNEREIQLGQGPAKVQAGFHCSVAEVVILRTSPPSPQSL